MACETERGGFALTGSNTAPPAGAVPAEVLGQALPEVLPDVLAEATRRARAEEVGWSGLEAVTLAPPRPEAPRPPLVDPHRLAGAQVRAWMAAAPSPGFAWDCLFSDRLVVSGIGNLALDGRPVTDPGLVPSYWRARYFANAQGDFLREAQLPVITLDAPCVSVLGWGWNVYGHFLIEALPKLLAVRRMLGPAWAGVRLLLRHDMPGWFRDICTNNLGLAPEQFFFFDPGRERVLLRKGIFPGLPLQDGCLHPEVRDLMGRVALRERAVPRAEKLFLSRRDLPEKSRLARGCANEAALCDIARAAGYAVYSPETEDWDSQIRRFRAARSIVGLYGSALHGALLCAPGTLTGFVGMLNPVQCQIASLMRQPFAACVEGIRPAPGFTVPEATFRRFLDGIEAARR